MMDEKHIITGVMVDETTTISFLEVCQKYQLSEDSLWEMVEYGLVEQTTDKRNQMIFDYKSLRLIQVAHRLKEELGVNIPGAVLVLELLDELESLRKDLQILQHHVSNLDE